MVAAVNPTIGLLADLPARISDVVLPWAERSPDRAALVDSGGTWTYGQLAAVIVETRCWLLARGVRPGDRVMIVGENCRALVAVILAAAALDAWPVIVNARLSDREIDQIREHSGARRLLYTATASPLAKSHAGRHGARIEDVAQLGPIGIGPLNDAAEPEPIDPERGAQVAALIYTSGTTGRPKGVMLTHRNLLFIASVAGMVRALGQDDRVYGVLPISHIVGLTVIVLGTLLRGATLYLCPRFDPAAALNALERQGLTMMLGVPAMYQLLLEYVKQRGLPSIAHPALRNLSSCGAPLDPALKSSVERLFGMPLHNGYGITECSPTIAQTRIEAPPTDCTVGPALPGVEIKLVGADGKPAGDDEPGELWVRGPNVMKGYYRAPEETAAAIDGEGWFNTRDLARIENGNLYIVGRTKELIIRFGFNVYPAEIEAVLNAHPAVTQSAVIGQQVGANEEVIAFVQLMPDSPITDAELADYAAQNLVSYKRPSKIFMIPAMPASSTGKILKSELAAMAAARAIAEQSNRGRQPIHHSSSN
jgi:acyl-CoA synthetase (AMP-forming)/AMP-acid ligase II